MDSFCLKLSYSRLLLIGFGFVFSQPIDHGWGFAAKSGMGSLTVVELDPFSDTGLRLCSGFPGVEVDAFVFQAPPQPLHEDVVEEPALAIHRDEHALTPGLKITVKSVRVAPKPIYLGKIG